MASNKKDFLNLPSEFISPILFASFLILILNTTGTSLALSVFFGIVGGLTLGWINEVNKNNPQAQFAASQDGIDAGLKYWLFFLLGFSLLKYPALISILLGAIAGVGGGWMVAWWGTKEETRTQLPQELLEEVEGEQINERPTRQQKRRATRRFRRSSGQGINLRFWER